MIKWFKRFKLSRLIACIGTPILALLTGVFIFLSMVSLNILWALVGFAISLGVGIAGTLMCVFVLPELTKTIFAQHPAFENIFWNFILLWMCYVNGNFSVKLADGDFSLSVSNIIFILIVLVFYLVYLNIRKQDSAYWVHTATISKQELKAKYKEILRQEKANKHQYYNI